MFDPEKFTLARNVLYMLITPLKEKITEVIQEDSSRVNFPEENRMFLF